ncbi:hypothetical protein G8767_33480 [Rhodococcus sp. IC4_135]|uniref:hypothetical protein n=1 Tax=Rhodococcus sp. IC4_135 TaxID=2715537 RepID=UPI001421D3BD|nr:hypothetical protein [Rhodococcus sp. IC4_135]
MAVQRIIVNVEMEDGTVHENVKTNISDQMKTAAMQRKQKWGSAVEDPVSFTNYITFIALYRQGLFTGSWEAFCNEAAAIEQVETEDIDPTTATPSNV